MVFVATAPAHGVRGATLKNQKPELKTFPPSTIDRNKPGVGKFVIFTRESVGKVEERSDFIAGAWECIPSRPETPITKRVEFYHSSWNCAPLLDVLVADDSNGMHTRFAKLQVENGDRDVAFNLYDINYRTWDVRLIWRGERFDAFGVMGGSIFCVTGDGWLLVDAASGKLNKSVPFTPVSTDHDYWLVRKAGEIDGCWSYDRKKRRYIAHFGPVVEPGIGFSRSLLSNDGRNRAWLLVPRPPEWDGGAVAGTLILQRSGKREDVSVPVEMWANPGSGRPVIPVGIQLEFPGDGKLEFRASKGPHEAEDRVWSIDMLPAAWRRIVPLIHRLPRTRTLF
jgi:hypothetical protein